MSCSQPPPPTPLLHVAHVDCALVFAVVNLTFWGGVGVGSAPDFFAYLANGVLPATIQGASTSGAAIGQAIVADPLKPPLSVCYSPVTCFSNLAADNVNYRENVDGAGYGGPGGGGGGLGLTLFCGR